MCNNAVPIWQPHVGKHYDNNNFRLSLLLLYNIIREKYVLLYTYTHGLSARSIPIGLTDVRTHMLWLIVAFIPVD